MLSLSLNKLSHTRRILDFMPLHINHDSMSLSIEPGRVARNLPDLDAVLDDPRLRPIGLVGGAAALLLAAVLQLTPLSPFWSAVVGGVLAFVGVPLVAVGLAAPEPAEGSPFRLGVNLNATQRRVVVAGSVLVLLAPIVVATLGPFVGFADWVWILAAVVAFVGAVLVLVGFVAWTSRAIAEPSSTR